MVLKELLVIIKGDIIVIKGDVLKKKVAIMHLGNLLVLNGRISLEFVWRIGLANILFNEIVVGKKYYF